MRDPEGRGQIQKMMSQLLANAGFHKQELWVKHMQRKVSLSLQILYFL